MFQQAFGKNPFEAFGKNPFELDDDSNEQKQHFEGGDDKEKIQPVFGKNPFEVNDDPNEQKQHFEGEDKEKIQLPSDELNQKQHYSEKKCNQNVQKYANVDSSDSADDSFGFGLLPQTNNSQTQNYHGKRNLENSNEMEDVDQVNGHKKQKTKPMKQATIAFVAGNTLSLSNLESTSKTKTHHKMKKIFTVEFQDTSNDPWGLRVAFKSADLRVGVVTGKQAERLGICKDDIIISRNNVTVNEYTRADIERHLRQGSGCKLTFRRKMPTQIEENNRRAQDTNQQEYVKKKVDEQSKEEEKSSKHEQEMKRIEKKINWKQKGD